MIEQTSRNLKVNIYRHFKKDIPVESVDGLCSSWMVVLQKINNQVDLKGFYDRFRQH